MIQVKVWRLTAGTPLPEAMMTIYVGMAGGGGVKVAHDDIQHYRQPLSQAHYCKRIILLSRHAKQISHCLSWYDQFLRNKHVNSLLISK